ncbi:MAG: hypothetical protein LBT69_04265 [Lactobacillales bacterium]|jgi:hypothetical protein|nr:hypothetical protein [Lactobacillales bacterium]
MSAEIVYTVYQWWIMTARQLVITNSLIWSSVLGMVAGTVGVMVGERLAKAINYSIPMFRHSKMSLGSIGNISLKILKNQIGDLKKYVELLNKFINGLYVSHLMWFYVVVLVMFLGYLGVYSILKRWCISFNSVRKVQMIPLGKLLLKNNSLSAKIVMSFPSFIKSGYAFMIPTKSLFIVTAVVTLLTELESSLSKQAIEFWTMALIVPVTYAVVDGIVQSLFDTTEPALQLDNNYGFLEQMIVSGTVRIWFRKRFLLILNLVAVPIVVLIAILVGGLTILGLYKPAIVAMIVLVVNLSAKICSQLVPSLVNAEASTMNIQLKSKTLPKILSGVGIRFVQSILEDGVYLVFLMVVLNSGVILTSNNRMLLILVLVLGFAFMEYIFYSIIIHKFAKNY